MGTIEIHDGVTKREIQVPTLRDTIEIHTDRKRVVVPAGFDVVLEDEPPSP